MTRETYLERESSRSDFQRSLVESYELDPTSRSALGVARSRLLVSR